MIYPLVKMPHFLKIERGNIKHICRYINEIGTSKSNVFFITDKVIYNLYGYKVEKILSSNFNLIDKKIITSSNISDSFNLSNQLLEGDVEILVGLGGGKVLDVGKHAAFICKINFISIPTAISHDGISSPIAVLNTRNGVKSIGCQVPSGIVIDLDVIRSSPVELKKAGVGDILSNYTAILDWKLAANKGQSEINDFALLLAETAYNAVINHGKKDFNDFDFLKQLAESVILSGLAMNISGNSRPCSGSEHLISHYMDKYEKGNLHGIQVAISSLISTILHDKDPSDLISFLKQFGIPTSIKDIGFNESDFYQILQGSISTRPNRYTILNETDLSINNLSKIYEKLFRS